MDKNCAKIRKDIEIISFFLFLRYRNRRFGNRRFGNHCFAIVKNIECYDFL